MIESQALTSLIWINKCRERRGTMRFMEIARALDDQAMWHDTQAWLETKDTSTPRVKKALLDKPTTKPALVPKRKLRRPKRPQPKSPIPQQTRSSTPSRTPTLPSSQPVLRLTNSSSFSQGDLHGLHQAHMASPSTSNSQ